MWVQGEVEGVIMAAEVDRLMRLGMQVEGEAVEADTFQGLARKPFRLQARRHRIRVILIMSQEKELEGTQRISTAVIVPDIVEVTGLSFSSIQRTRHQR